MSSFLADSSRRAYYYTSHASNQANYINTTDNSKNDVPYSL